MLNIIWLLLMAGSVVFAVINGTVPAVVAAVTDDAKFAFETALGLTGLLSFWLGLMKIAEAAGLVQGLAKLLAPLLRWLFPEVPADHPAMGAIVMNITANLLGLTNAATPFGLRAMSALASLNPYPGTASNAMCTFLAINTSSLQLIPMTAIAYLSAANAARPTDIIATSLLASACAVTVAIIAVKILEKLPAFQIKNTAEKEVQ